MVVPRVSLALHSQHGGSRVMEFGLSGLKGNIVPGCVFCRIDVAVTIDIRLNTYRVFVKRNQADARIGAEVPGELVPPPHADSNE